jgi:hypothetical protein
MRTQASRSRTLHLNLAALCALAFLAGPSQAATKETPKTPIDPNIPSLQDSTDLAPAIESFKERYQYGLEPDSSTYGTTDQFRVLYPDTYWSERLSKITNEDGSLAWATSQDMLALAKMYDVTHERWYLDWLGRYSEAAMKARDDIAGKKDQEGRSEPGWGSSRYGNHERRIYLVHSGLIVDPILEYILRARKVDGADTKSLDLLLQRCKQTLLYHDYQLDPTVTGSEMVYLSGREEPDRRDTWQPFNRQNIFAHDFYLLYQLTGDEAYKERSKKLYTFFKDRIELTTSNAYIWEYEPSRFASGPVRVAVCDDVSHASYSIAPILAAAQNDFVFNLADELRLANTFTRYIYIGDGVFQTSMGCRVTFAPNIMERLYAWLPTAEADPRVYWLIRRFYLHNVLKPPALAIAYLVAYRPRGMSGIDTRVR